MRVKSLSLISLAKLTSIERISKRVNSRQRNRIQKKISDHHRKARKLAKKNPQWKSKKPKDLGVPNDFPFKEQVLAEREEARRKREEERRKRKTGTTVQGEEKATEESLENGYVSGLQVDSDEEMMMKMS
jgi:nuclear GTP-binding protein